MSGILDDRASFPPRVVERSGDGRRVAEVAGDHGAVPEHQQLVGDVGGVGHAESPRASPRRRLEPPSVGVHDLADRVVGVGVLGRRVDERAAAEARRAALGADPLGDHAEHLADPAPGGLPGPGDGVALPGGAAFEVGHDQVVLRGEVPVEGHLGDPDPGDDLLRAHRPDALRVEQVGRGLDDPLPHRRLAVCAGGAGGTVPTPTRPRPAARRAAVSCGPPFHLSRRPAAGGFAPGRDVLPSGGVTSKSTSSAAKEPDVPGPTHRPPVLFIHGLWIHADSWQNWSDLYRQAGYLPIAPGWPGDGETVAETRRNAAALAEPGHRGDHRELPAGDRHARGRAGRDRPLLRRPDRTEAAGRGIRPSRRRHRPGPDQGRQAGAARADPLRTAGALPPGQQEEGGLAHQEAVPLRLRQRHPAGRIRRTVRPLDHPRPRQAAVRGELRQLQQDLPGGGRHEASTTADRC
jgi:hypothetical protein